jgi:predicted transglutaminase-like cysteine proteinase
MVIRRNFIASAALGLTLTATLQASASAQALGTGAAASLTWSKSEAILGQSSALEAILAQQGAGSARTARAAQPSAYSVPLTYAVARKAFSRDDASTGRPDVFGSVALHVDRTPLDSRWRRVQASGVAGTTARYAESLRDRDTIDRLEAVNRYVNQRVRFTDDRVQFGRADIWSTAKETLRRGRGDCEDYAIAKMQMLRRAGVSSRDLYLVILRDLARRADHAVLVARAGGHMYLLDNGTDKIIETSEVSDYRPMLTFASYGEWTHGYRMTSASSTVMASAPQPSVTLTALADDQRSRSASLLAFNTGFNK